MALGKKFRALGRKRAAKTSYSGSGVKTPVMKKQRRESFGEAVLEALPREVLIKIVCGVDHKDLKQLFHVSTAIREATLIAKQWHFAYSTPTQVRAFQRNEDMDGIKTPNAPMQQRLHRTLFMDEDDE